MEYKFNRGSEWRKWDLHIHTPYSICQNYGGEYYFDKFIDALERLPKDVKVIGITDYYFIDGYEKVMQYKKKGRLENIDKIFPILEFRIDTFGSTNENKLSKINLHILFDIDESNLANEIKKVKEEFIALIPISVLDEHKTKMLSIDNFTGAGGGDLKNGFECSVPPTRQVFELINSKSWKDKIVCFAGYKEWSNLDKNNQLKPIKEDLYRNVLAFLSASPRSKFEKCQEWLNSYGDKRLLHSQDIHDFVTLDTANEVEGVLIASEQYYCDTWIKADPTFKGLKQALIEPHERVFVGDKPLIFDKIDLNKTKFIDSLQVTPTKEYSGNYGEWFNFNIQLNPGLVAIIGNKGSGKSAIADMIALCSNIENQDDFSFLHKDKFRGKNKPAKYFEAKLLFKDGASSIKNLNDSEIDNTNKLIKYLPQGYFERLCNEISVYNNLKRYRLNILKVYP